MCFSTIFNDFIDYNSQNNKKLRGKEYWKSFWDTFYEYLRHSESKFDGDIGVLERKHVRIISIVHIGKESNGLDESELFGLDDFSYEIYYNESEIDKKFKKLASTILELKPKDVREFEISKQSLWNVKKQNRNE